MKKTIDIFLVVLISLIIFACSPGMDTSIKEGDIIFHESQSRQSDYIKHVTGSRYTHVGIIFKLKSRFYVYEAVQPVRYTPLKKWIARGKNRHYVVKRLKNGDTILTKKVISQMKREGRKYYNKDYDNRFEWSNKKIYCSELVWKIYKSALNIEIGSPQVKTDFNLNDPKTKQEIKRRWRGSAFNKNDIVVTPARMFKSSLLKTIVNKN